MTAVDHAELKRLELDKESSSLRILKWPTSNGEVVLSYPQTMSQEDASDALDAIGIALRKLQETAHVTDAKINEWKPIETAPRDGSDLLLWDGRLRTGSWRIDEGCASKEPMWLDDSFDDFSTGFASTPLSPTHWMAIPGKPA